MTGAPQVGATAYLGIDIGGSSVKWTVLESGDAKKVVALTKDLQTLPEVVSIETPRSPDALLAEIQEIAVAAENRVGPLAGVCVGTPGPVDETGSIRGDAVNIQNWGNRPVQELIAAAIGKPTVVKNDTNLALLAESTVGAARGATHVIGVFLGTGIGGGLFLNGNLYEGHHGLAGEIGHTVVDPEGPLCDCGQRGCLERYASGRGIWERLRERAADHASVDQASRLVQSLRMDGPAAANGRPDIIPQFFEAVRAEDPTAVSVYDSAADALARAIGVAINTLAPERVVLGGGVAQGTPSLLEATMKRLPAYTLPACLEQATLIPADLSYRAGAIGAAIYARNHVSYTL